MAPFNDDPAGDAFAELAAFARNEKALHIILSWEGGPVMSVETDVADADGIPGAVRTILGPSFVREDKEHARALINASSQTLCQIGSRTEVGAQTQMKLARHALAWLVSHLGARGRVALGLLEDAYTERGRAVLSVRIRSRDRASFLVTGDTPAVVFGPETQEYHDWALNAGVTLACGDRELHPPKGHSPFGRGFPWVFEDGFFVIWPTRAGALRETCQ